MTGIDVHITTLNDREPVPAGSVTFGQLISEARKENKAEREWTKREKWHRNLHYRHCRRFRLELSLIDWERYVCRIGDEHAIWFNELTELGRMELCDYTRDDRRKKWIAYKNPWAENDALAYSGL